MTNDARIFHSPLRGAAQKINENHQECSRWKDGTKNQHWKDQK